MSSLLQIVTKGQAAQHLHEDVRIAGLAKHRLQNVQLCATEGGSFTTALPVTCEFTGALRGFMLQLWGQFQSQMRMGCWFIFWMLQKKTVRKSAGRIEKGSLD